MVDEYHRQFLALLCRCEDLTLKQHVNLFTAGLGEPLRTDVELQTPTNLQQAMSLARAYGRRMMVTVKNGPGRGNNRNPPMTTAPPSGQKQPNQIKPRFKRLSAEELAAKRVNGECYHCTEKYSADHKCTSKGVFLLELEDGMEDGDTTDELGISLHALTGIDYGETMKLHISINGTAMVALVDSGATHTFIREYLATKIGMSVQARSGLSVKVANGDKITSSGICIGQQIIIDKEQFNMTCYVLPLAGLEVVLGVQWLRSLGPILWNFRDLSMAFWHNGRSVRLAGMGGSEPHCTSLQTTKDLLATLLESFADIFEAP